MPKVHRVAAMLSLAPIDVPEVSKMRMIGLVANVTAQLKRLNLCMSNTQFRTSYS